MAEPVPAVQILPECKVPNIVGVGTGTTFSDCLKAIDACECRDCTSYFTHKLPDSIELTWEALVEMEPRLADLLAEAEAFTSHGNPRFCANAVWYGYGGHDGMKLRLTRMAGWGAWCQEPLLHTIEAYDLAYDRVYSVLPPCRKCLCIGA